MTYHVKERIGLPIWEDDFVRGTKHFYPGTKITQADFEEARQDEEQQAELIHFNCYTDEQHESRVKIDQIDEQLTKLRRGINELHVVDLDKMQIAVVEGREQEHAQLQSDIKKLEQERNKLEASLNDQ